MRESLKRLLVEGRLGNLELGSHRDVVHDILGEPTHWEGAGTIPYAKAMGWFYGVLEIWFENDLAAVIRFFVGGWGERKDGNPFTPIDFFDIPRMESYPLTTFRSWLRENRIDFFEAGGSHADIRIVKGCTASFIWWKTWDDPEFPSGKRIHDDQMLYRVECRVEDG